MPDNKTLLTTAELAEYLRLGERKIYDLVAKREIPCTRVAGKWLFPRELVDAWLRERTQGPAAGRRPTPPPAIVAGSHDPLLEWAVRESGSGLAVLFDGSLDGLERLARRQAQACGMHVIEGEAGGYNVQTVRHRLPDQPVVLVEWAKREQGLIIAPGNPGSIRGIRDLPGRRFAFRQASAGSHVLLETLLAQESIDRDQLQPAGEPARNETEVALAILDGRADVGLGVASVARQFRLEYLPIAHERYDLLVWRHSWFEPHLQNLMRFTRRPPFKRKAEELGGYDLTGLGTVRYNGPESLLAP
ncbi:MAG: helix-turn-helix transcriptional regulator [Gammaproteobacteria bacterium]